MEDQRNVLQDDNIAAQGEDKAADGKRISFFAKHKRALTFFAMAAAATAFVVLLTVFYFVPSYHYNRAKNLIEEGNFTDAYFSLIDSNGFKDANQLLADFTVEYKDISHTQFASDGTVIEKRSQQDDYDHMGHNILTCIKDEDGNIIHKCTSEILYDQDGNVIRETKFNKDGSPFSSFEKHSYISILINYNGDGSIESKTIEDYNQYGDLLLTTKYNESGDTSYTRYSYDYEHYQNGKVKYKTQRDADGKTLAVYRYDESGKPKSQTQFGYNGKVSAMTRYEENDIGTKELYYESENGTFILLNEYQYDKDQNMVSLSYYKSDGSLSLRVEREFNENGKPTLILNYGENNKLISREEFSYDENGNEILQISYRNGFLNRKERQYDNCGRLICSISYSDPDEHDFGMTKTEYTYSRDGYTMTEWLIRKGGTTKLNQSVYRQPVAFYKAK